MISLLSRPFCSSCSAQAIPTRHSLTESEVITPQPRSSIFYGSHTSGFSTNSAIHTQLSKLPVSPDSTSSRTLMEHIEQNYNPDHIKVIMDNIQWYALACHYCDGKGQLPDNLSNVQVKNLVKTNNFPDFESAQDLLESEDYTTLTLYFTIDKPKTDPTEKPTIEYISHKMYLEYLFRDCCETGDLN